MSVMATCHFQKLNNHVYTSHGCFRLSNSLKIGWRVWHALEHISRQHLPRLEARIVGTRTVAVGVKFAMSGGGASEQNFNDAYIGYQIFHAEYHVYGCLRKCF